MKKKKIYIICRNSRGTLYGVGTYKIQLIKCLKQAGIEFGVIELYAPVNEITIKHNDGYELISLPFPPMETDNTKYRVYLLRELIPNDLTYELIFHVNLMNDHVLVSYLKKLFKCRIILTIHYTNWSFDLLGNTKKLEDILAKKKNELNDSQQRIRKDFDEDIKMAQKSDYVVYVSQGAENTLSRYVKPKKAIVINNGLEDAYKKISFQEKYSIKAKYYIESSTKVIIFAGRLDEVKGVKYLIQAFKKILQNFPNTLLVIAGDGEFSPLLKISENIWSKIIYTGKIERQKLYELYQIADIGVVTSLYEEFGYVAVEMMMHELPVIASNTGGLAEIIENGISGIKIPIITRKGERSLNTKLLASKISFLLENDKLAIKLGQGGRRRFLEKYELSIFTEKMWQVYYNL